MNLIHSSSYIHKLTELSFEPAHLAQKHNRTSFRGTIEARLLHATQLAVSLLAIPLISLLGLSAVAFQLLKCDGSQAKSTLQATMASLTLHFLGLIPYSLVGICTTERYTEESLLKLRSFTEKVSTIWNCTCCQSGYNSDDKMDDELSLANSSADRQPAFKSSGSLSLTTNISDSLAKNPPRNHQGLSRSKDDLELLKHRPLSKLNWAP